MSFEWLMQIADKLGTPALSALAALGVLVWLGREYIRLTQELNDKDQKLHSGIIKTLNELQSLKTKYAEEDFALIKTKIFDDLGLKNASAASKIVFLRVPAGFGLFLCVGGARLPRPYVENTRWIAYPLSLTLNFSI